MSDAMLIQVRSIMFATAGTSNETHALIYRLAEVVEALVLEQDAGEPS